MPQPLENQADVRRSALWLPGGSTNRDDRSEREKFEAKPYFWAAWHLIKQDLSLLIWKFGADFVRATVILGVTLLLAALVTVEFGTALEATSGPAAGLTSFAEGLASPAFVIGATGALFCAWLIGLMVEVLVFSGLWGAFAQGASGREIRPLKTFLSGLSRHFPSVLALRLCTLAAQAAVALLGVVVIAAVWMATTEPSALATQSVWVRATIWATSLTVLGILAALVRLTMEVAAAPLILRGEPVGSAILGAAVLVTRRFVPIYRLVVTAASIMIVPLFLYWGVILAQNVVFAVPELGPVVALVRLAADVLLFVSVGVVAVFFYGALFFYYADEAGLIDALPGRDASKGKKETSASSAHRTHETNGAGKTRPSFDRKTTLEQLVPEAYPNIVSLDDVVSGPRVLDRDRPSEPNDEAGRTDDSEHDDTPPSDNDETHDRD